jgi:hypothetical protein
VPKKLIRAAAVVYFILTAFWLLVGLAQMAVVIFGMEEATTATTLLSIQSICIGHLYAAFGVGLVLQKSWAKRWGIWAAVLTVPLVPVTGSYTVAVVFLVLPYLTIIGLLVTEKILTRKRSDKAVPAGADSEPRE